jgi:hypothetical protein
MTETNTPQNPPEGEENKNQQIVPDPTGGQDQSGFNQADYTRKTQALARLKQEAEDYGFDDPEEFVAELKKRAEKANTPPPEQTPPPKTNTGQNEAYDQFNKNAAVLNLNIQWNEFKLDQMEAPPEEKLNITKKEVYDYLSQDVNAFLIEKIVNREIKAGRDSNYCKVAAQLIVKERSAADLIKKGADSQKALNDAANSAKVIQPTGEPNTPAPKITPGQEKASRIAPVTTRHDGW